MKMRICPAVKTYASVRTAYFLQYAVFRKLIEGPCVILKSCAMRVVHAASARIVDRIFFMFVRLFGSFPFGAAGSGRPRSKVSKNPDRPFAWRPVRTLCAKAGFRPGITLPLRRLRRRCPLRSGSGCRRSRDGGPRHRRRLPAGRRATRPDSSARRNARSGRT